MVQDEDVVNLEIGLILANIFGINSLEEAREFMTKIQKDTLRWSFKEWLPAVILGAINEINRSGEGTPDAGIPIRTESIFTVISNRWPRGGGPWKICFPPKEWLKLDVEERRDRIEEELERMEEVVECPSGPFPGRRWQKRD